MKLTFLGTSAGKPTKERNVSALALKFDKDDKWYLFDCGEGTQRQIILSGLCIKELDTIFITHLHGDHYYGLPGLLSTKKLDMALKPLSVYGPQGIKKFLECAIDISKSHLGYKLNIIEYIPQNKFKFDKFSLKILPLLHCKDSSAFYIKENDITNKLNEEKPEPMLGRSLIIAGDNSRPDILDNYLENLNLLVHECTYTQEVYDNLTKKVLHTTAKDLGIAAQKKHVKNLIANHINPQYDQSSALSVDMLYYEIKCNYTGEFFVAKDFDVYYLSRDRLISLI